MPNIFILGAPFPNILLSTNQVLLPRAIGNGPGIASRTVPAPIGAAKLAAAAPLRCLNLVPAPAEAAAEAAVEAEADKRPSPGSPSRPGTSASPVAVAEVAAAEVEEAVAAARRNYT